jgi:GDP-D-mannose 3', 5'-epimerase
MTEGKDRRALVEIVTINELARLVIEVAGEPGITLRHVDGPQGVRGHNSDNTRLRKELGWEPRTRLGEGLASTHRWIEKQARG